MPNINEYKLGKYKFSFVAPRKINDAHGYYYLKSINGIPKDFIRIYFDIRKSEDAKKAETNSVSIPTWEATKSKFIVILANKTKENYKDTQNEIMEELSTLLQRIYRQAQITVIPIESESEEEDSEDEQEI